MMSTKSRIEFGIGIGFNKNGEKLVDVETKIQKALKLTAEKFGGFRAERGSGGWISPTNELVLEPSLTIVVYVDVEISRVCSFAVWLQEYFEQEVVLLTIQPADVEFVSGDRQ